MATPPASTEGEQVSNPGSPGTSPTSTGPVSGLSSQERRKKGMSIGNAASLFGAPISGPAGNEGDAEATSPVDFFGQLAGGPKYIASPVTSKTPFAAVAEDAEEENTANLFADSGQDWLGSSIGAAGHSAQAGGEGLMNKTQHLYDDYAQQYHQYAFVQNPNDPSDLSQSQYTPYNQPQYPSQNNPGYWDQSQSQPQQQYEQGFQSQAHPGYSYIAQEEYPQQKPANAYEPSASFYPNQYSTQTYQPQLAYNYSPQLQQQQSESQSPFSVQPSPSYMNPMSRSQSRAATSVPTYASSYSQAYDPYAPDPSTSLPNQGLSHLAGQSAPPYTQAFNYANPPHPGLSYSQSAASLPQATSNLTASTGSSHGSQKAKLLRSATSFFAELPPLPPKVRPATAMGQAPLQSSLNPGGLPAFSTPPEQRATPPPPPPKSRTPAPPPTSSSLQNTFTQPRPSSGASMSSSNGRPASRTAQLQSGTYLRRASLEQQANYAQGSFGTAFGSKQSSDSMAAGFDSTGAQIVTNGRYSIEEPNGYGLHDRTCDELHVQQKLDMQRDLYAHATPNTYSQFPYGGMPSEQSGQTLKPMPKSHLPLRPPLPFESQSQYPSSDLPAAVAAEATTDLNSRVASDEYVRSENTESRRISAEDAYSAYNGDRQRVSEQLADPDRNVDSLAKPLQESSLSAKHEEEEAMIIPVIKHEEEEDVLPSSSIAVTHEQVDSLPNHAEDQNVPAVHMHLEPFERSITLDAYLPPSPKMDKGEPLSAPREFSAASYPPSPNNQPTIFGVKQEEEDLAVPEVAEDEEEAGRELYRAERKLERDGMLQSERPALDIFNQSQSVQDPYSSGDGIYQFGESASQRYAQEAPSYGQDPYELADTEPKNLKGLENLAQPQLHYDNDRYDNIDQSSYPDQSNGVLSNNYNSSDRPSNLYEQAGQAAYSFEHSGQSANSFEHSDRPAKAYRSHDPYADYSEYGTGQDHQQISAEDPIPSDDNQHLLNHKAELDPYGAYVTNGQPLETSNAPYDPYGSAPAAPVQFSQPYAPYTRPQVLKGSIGQQAQPLAYADAPEQPSPYDPYAVSADHQYMTPPARILMNEDAVNYGELHPPVPIATFGFSGKLVTFFPSSLPSSSSSAPSYGMPYDQQSISSSTAAVTIRRISSLLPRQSSVIEAFPGPLFMEYSSSNAAGKAKKKKEVVTWLDSRIEEGEKEIGYVGVAGSVSQWQDAEERTILLKLVKAVLENDGKLSGSIKIDETIRNTLLPNLMSVNPLVSTFSATAESRKESITSDSTLQSRSSIAAYAQDADLDAIQTYLLRGDKREAVRYALDHTLWAHALVISAGVDKDLQASVTREFMQAELAGLSGGTVGREPLKVAYSIFSGAGATSIQDFIPPRSLLAHQAHPQSLTSLSAAAPYAPTSRSSTPLLTEYPSDISVQVLTKWRETAAMIVANRAPGDSLALTNLGDVLSANGCLKAAHACYLLSPQTSPLGGPSVPTSRYALLGGQQAFQQPTSARDLDAISLTEVLEFALSFIPVSKGQEAYIGLPHLQAYRFVHALELSDLGFHSQAQKYCDAIGATLKLATKASPYYHPALLGQVKELSERLSFVGFQDKSGSWIARKVPRPTLDNVWSTLEGRFAKFVAGEAEDKPVEVTRRKQAEEAARVVAGPFAHYSSITPQGPDSISRNTSSTDLSRATPPLPPQATSVPNTITKNISKTATHHRRSSSFGYGPYGADPYPPYVPQVGSSIGEEVEQQQQQQDSSEPSSRHSYEAGYNQPEYGYVTPQNDTGWWPSSNGTSGLQQDSPFGGSNNTPGYGHPPMFSPVAEGYVAEDANGLMSPMNFDNNPFTNASQSSRLGTYSSQGSAQATIEEDDDDELGLGNASAKRTNQRLSSSEGPATRRPSGDDSGKAPAAAATKKANEEKTLKPAASSSWLGRIFRRDGGSPTPVAGTGPIKAKLGEDTSFVYDPVEKRWVNKKAGGETPPQPATAPPPRAQTASPTAASYTYAAHISTPPPSIGPFAITSSNATPPQARSAAMGTPPPPPSTSATPPPMSQNSSASSGGLTKPDELPPPPKRPATAAGGASRKNVRARYVDILAQQ